MEHLVIIPDGLIQEVPAGLVQSAGVFAVFLIQKICIGLRLIRSIAVNGGDPQFLRRISCHLLLKFLIVKSCHRNRSHTENRIKSTDALLLFDFLNLTVRAGSHIRYVHQRIENVSLIASICFLIKVFQNIFRHQLNPLGCHKRFLAVNIPDFLVIDIRIGVHCFDIVHPERQNVFIIDRVNNGVGVKLISERLLGCEKLRVPNSTGIGCKDRCPCKSEQMIFPEALDNGRMHVTKLAAVAFVKDNDYMFLIDLMARILLDEGRELLDGRDNDMGIRIFQLALQDHSAGIAVGSTLLEAVIFLHGLVIQIFAVYYKENLIDIGKLRGLPGCLKGCQGLAGAGRVPDIPAASHGAVFLIIVGDFDPVHDPLGRRDLIRPHDHQHVL